MKYLLVLITISAMVVGQIVLKYGQSSLLYPREFSVKQIFLAIINNLFNIYFISAAFFVLVGALSWTLVIQKFNLSLVYPFMSLTYVLIFLASYLLFKESISIYQVVGMILIVVGLIFISLK